MAKIFRRISVKKNRKSRKTKSNRKLNKIVIKGGGATHSTNSKAQQEMWAREVEHAQAKALDNFNKRVRSWSYPHHGPYDPYIKWCREQYQLESIPQSWRQGSMDSNANAEFEENMRQQREYGY
jgi:hypothetical protein